MKRPGIVCTLGPATSSVPVLRRLIDEGMTVARLNLSHGSHAEHAVRVKALRRAAKAARRHVGVLLDLAGYRIRVGRFRNGQGIPLERRARVHLTNRPVKGRLGLIPFDYPGDLNVLRAGTAVFLDDGNLALTVVKPGKHTVVAEVVVGGFLKERKGVNVPALRLDFEGLTAKDEADLKFAVKLGADMVAQSFVRDERDVMAVRGRLKSLKRVKVVAKVENHEGICNIDHILEFADGIMVARGDLGVSLPVYEVPMIQKMIIRRSNRRKKFVITATQMLDSMTENPRPTRAEVTDVANAILDGTDYVMLSGETAVGRYPVETVRMMRQIADFTSKSRELNALSYCRYYGADA